MATTLRWGILSTADINDSIIGPLREARRSDLVAVASRDREKAQAYAAEREIGRAYGDYEELINAPDIDVVYNSLPNTMHEEWTVAALNAGKHVLCEKPMVTNEAQLDRIEAAQQASGKVVFEAVKYLHHPQTWQIIQSLQENKWGKLQMVQGWLHFYLPPDDQSNIRLDPQLGGGAYWDLGVYPAGYAISLNGGEAPEEVYAFSHKGDADVDLSMNVQMRFRTGCVAQIGCSFRTPWRDDLYIACDQAVVHIPTPFSAGEDGQESHYRVTRLEKKDDGQVTAPARNPFLGEVEQMEACVLDGAPPMVPLALSREFVRTALAVYESAASGHPVHIAPRLP
jgi:predicted dehydrogenase